MNDDELEAWAAAYRVARKPSAQTRRAIERAVRDERSARASRTRPRHALRWAVCSVGLLAALLAGLFWGSLASERAQRTAPEPPSLTPDLNDLAPPVEGLLAEGTPRPHTDVLDASPGASAALNVAPASTTPRPRRTAKSGSPGDVTDEMRLLRQAQQRLRDDPPGALELLRRHASTFPHSPLALEREALVVLALCRSHAHREAGRRARTTFLRQHGDSAYAARIRDACDAPDDTVMVSP